MSDLRDRIAKLIDAAGPGHVWVPADFAPLGNRGVIDKTLQRMAAQRDLRRIDRGLAQGFNVLPAWMQAYLRTVPGFDAALTARSSLSPDRKSPLSTTESPPKPKRG